LVTLFDISAANYLLQTFVEKLIPMDTDLDVMSKDQLVAEVVRLRQAIRAHRDASGHNLCWHHPDLWALLPEKTAASIVVPAWPEFMQGCVRYRQSLDEQVPDAPRVADPYSTESL